MNTMSPEQFVATQQAAMETLFGLTAKAFEGVEKLVELNMQVAKASMSEAADAARATLAVKDVQELMAMQANLLQPSAEKAAAYSRHVYEIMSETSSQFTKTAESTMADNQKRVLSLVDTAAKNAPAGTESAVAMMKSAVAAANNAFETVQKASKQAAEVAEANFQTMTHSAVTATKQATAAAKGKRAA